MASHSPPAPADPLLGTAMEDSDATAQILQLVDALRAASGIAPPPPTAAPGHLAVPPDEAAKQALPKASLARPGLRPAILTVPAWHPAADAGASPAAAGGMLSPITPAQQPPATSFLPDRRDSHTGTARSSQPAGAASQALPLNLLSLLGLPGQLPAGADETLAADPGQWAPTPGGPAGAPFAFLPEAGGLLQFPLWSAADVLPATLGSGVAAGTTLPPMPAPAGQQEDGQEGGRWRAPRRELPRAVDLRCGMGQGQPLPATLGSNARRRSQASVRASCARAS